MGAKSALATTWERPSSLVPRGAADQTLMGLLGLGTMRVFSMSVSFSFRVVAALEMASFWSWLATRLTHSSACFLRSRMRLIALLRVESLSRMAISRSNCACKSSSLVAKRGSLSNSNVFQKCFKGICVIFEHYAHIIETILLFVFFPMWIILVPVSAC